MNFESKIAKVWKHFSYHTQGAKW